MKHERLTPYFVEIIPEQLDEAILYVSMTYSTAAHRCACGCGEEVITPFSPTDWQMFFDGESISLRPSIGNWNFKCRSHYWVKANAVRWAADMSKDAIESLRKRDRMAKASYYGRSESIPPGDPELESISIRATATTAGRKNLWDSMKRRWQKKTKRGLQ